VRKDAAVNQPVPALMSGTRQVGTTPLSWPVKAAQIGALVVMIAMYAVMGYGAYWLLAAIY
jgi:hypothetical protein